MNYYHPECPFRTCLADCCNIYKRCPSTSYFATYDERTCYYRYRYQRNNLRVVPGGAIAGYVIAGLAGLVLIIIGIVWFIRKRRAAASNQQEISQGQTIAAENSFNQINQPTYPQAYPQVYPQGYQQGYQ